MVGLTARLFRSFSRLTKATLITSIIGVSACGQVDSTSLRASFGSPTTTPRNEIFTVASDVHMNVVYDAVGQACVLKLTPDHWTKYSDRTRMAQKLTEILDKAVPANVRGKNLNAVMETINGCAGSRLTRYERVDVTETIFSNANPNCVTEMRVIVYFKRNSCSPIR
jgi:hypothetical protein